MSAVSRWLARIDALSRRAAWLVLSVLSWPAIVGAGAGAGAWALTHRGARAAMAKNELPAESRTAVLIWVGVALLVVGGGYTLAALRRRRQAEPAPLPAFVARLHRLSTGLLVLPVMGALATPGLEKDHPWLALLYVLLGAAAVGVSLWELAAARPDGSAPGWLESLRSLASSRSGGVAVAVLLALMWLGYAAFFSDLAITNHHALNTRTADLGLYDNIFYQTIHGNLLGCTFIKGGYHGTAHFDPILVLLSPLYLLYPRAEMLLVLQSVWLGAGLIPVYLIGRHHLGSRLVGLVFAAAYAVYPALHGANMYEFHSLSLLGLPLLWALAFLELGTARRYFLVLPFVLLVREDAALVMCFLGAGAILSGRPGHVRIGWITIGVALAWFGVVKGVFMTSPDLFNSGSKSISFAYYYDEMIPHGNGLGGFATTLLTNPAFVLELVTREEKLLFAMVLLVPLLALPLLAPRGRFALLYGFVFLFMASRSAVYSPHFQYSTVLYPFLFALAPAGLRWLSDRRGGARTVVGVAAALLVSSLLMSWKFGGIVDNESFRGGFRPVVRSLSETQRALYDEMWEVIDQVPEGVSLAASTRVGPHISNRKRAVTYDERSADYVLIDTLGMRSDLRKRHAARLRDGKLAIVARTEHFQLYQVVPKDRWATGAEDEPEERDDTPQEGEPDEDDGGGAEPGTGSAAP